jgi:hypothetical protein
MPRKTKKTTATVKKRPEQTTALQTIIKTLVTQPMVPLTDMERLRVALELEQLLPKKEQAGIERQRLLKSIEDALVTAKWVKKNVWPKRGQGGRSAIEAVREVIFKDPDDLRSRFQSPAALAQFLKRERPAKKKK